LFTKIKFKIQFLTTFIKRHFIAILTILLVISLPVVFRKQIINIIFSPNFQTQRIALEGLYTNETLPSEISNKISYGLTSISENNKPINSPLVKAIENNGDQEYTFTLNSDIRWHDGKKLTSKDINYQIFGATITHLSDQKFKITLETKFAPLLSNLSRPLFKKNLVGLGDYQVKKINYKEGYIKTLLLKSIDKNKPSLKYNFYSSEKDVIDAFKLAVVDQIKITSLPEEFNNWKNVDIKKNIETNDKYIAIFLNTQKIPDKKIRQALAYATPRTKEKNERAFSPISPTSWAYNPAVKEYNFSRSRAIELFNKESLPQINLIINNRTLLPLAEKIKNSWADVLDIEASFSIENQIDFQNFDAILAYSANTNDPDQYNFWHSTQTNTNITKLNNSRIDKLLEEGRAITDPIERKNIYQNFQKYLLEESPAIFLSYPVTYTITRLK
jgi:ABC-type transport system substrate-binding protein